MPRRTEGDIRTARDRFDRAIHCGFNGLASGQHKAKPHPEHHTPQPHPAALIHHADILPDWPRASKHASGMGLA
jgi:hypothetical protein